MAKIFLYLLVSLLLQQIFATNINTQYYISTDIQNYTHTFICISIYTDIHIPTDILTYSNTYQCLLTYTHANIHSIYANMNKDTYTPQHT